MIQSLLILLIGIGVGVAAAGRLSRRRTGEREVRVQVHELELMTGALVHAKGVLFDMMVRMPYPWARVSTADSARFRSEVEEALSRVKLALGEGNGHAAKHDKKRGVWT